MSNRTVPKRPCRVAVFGGDGRALPQLKDQGEMAMFCSPGSGGNGDVKRLEAGLKAGTYAKLVILVRWNSHSSTRKLYKLCQRMGIPVEVYPSQSRARRAS